MSRYNRLSRPIAVMGGREAYKHLCDHCGLNPHNNDIFTHVESADDALEQEFSRVLEIHGAEFIRDYNFVKSLAMRQVRNDTTANKSDLHLGDG